MRYNLSEEHEEWLVNNAHKSTRYEIAAHISYPLNYIVKILNERGLTYKSSKLRNAQGIDWQYEHKLKEIHKQNRRVLAIVDKCKQGHLGPYTVVKMYPYCVLLLDKRGHRWCPSYNELAVKYGCS